jgi:predicted TIM-barrel fold metal-dependent hydrolase
MLWRSSDERIFVGFKAIVRDFSDAERSRFSVTNARRAYRIDRP